MQIARPLTALGYTGDPDCSEKSSTSRLREAEADGVPVTISFHVEDGGEAEGGAAAAHVGGCPSPAEAHVLGSSATGLLRRPDLV